MTNLRRCPALRYSAGCVVLLAALSALPAQDPAPPVAPAAPAAPAADQKPLPKAEDILESFVTATGGREAYGRMTTQVAHFSGGIPQAGMEVTLVTKAKAPDLVFIRMEFKDVMDQTVGHDGKIAWSKDQMLGLRELKGAERAKMLRESTFNSPLHWKKLYKEVRTKEVRKIDGRECAVVELVPEEGDPLLQFFDLETKLLVRQESVEESPVGKQKVRTSMSDYKDHACGVKMAHTIKIAAGPLAFALKASKIEVNVPIDDAEFKMPAADGG